jgi:hypothetical protein
MTASFAPAMECEAHEMGTSFFNGQRNTRFQMKQRKGRFDEQYQLAGAEGIEPCNNPLPHKDFSIPARPFDSIDSKAKALVGMTDDEVVCVPKTLNPTIVVMESTKDGA